MDYSSPENSFIARSLKDLDRFITSTGQTSGFSKSHWDKSSSSPRMQLNFSDADESMVGGVKRKSEQHANEALKKHRDSVTGLDVCRLLRDKESEMVDLRATITQLKAELSSANTAHTKIKLDYDNELSQLRLNDLRNREMKEELELKLKNERSLLESMKESYNKLRAESSQVRSSSQQSVSSTTVHYTLENGKLKEELASLREKHSNLEKKLHDKSCELDLSESEARSLREEVSRHVRQAKELRLQLMEVDSLKLQLQKEQALNKELEGRLLSLSSQEHLATSFESSVKRLPDLERQLVKLQEENSMYRACSANTRLLEEQVASATDEIKLLQQRCHDTTQLRAQLDHLKAQVAAFDSVVMSELSLSCSPQPEELRALLKGLRSSDQSLTDSITAMRESVASHERQCKALEKEAAQLRDSTQHQKTLSDRHVAMARRLQRKNTLVTKERDSLKAILTSYESEATMTAATAASCGRLQSLEDTLARYKQEMRQLEQQLDDYQRTPALPGDKPLLSASDRAEMTRLQEQVAELQEQVSKLQEEKEVLEYRLEQRALKGDYDPSQVQVLHMKENPTAEAVDKYRSEVSKLEEEVRKLKEQLLAYQMTAELDGARPIPSSSAVTPNAPVTPSITDADKARLQELEKEVKSMEVKHQRLMEAFKVKSKEMRELVYRVTGYLVLPAADNCYKLSSMYAESPEDFFMFELATNGEIRLLATEFSNSLDDMIDAYLNHENSYPAFLSAVTIDLFNRQSHIARSPSSSPQHAPPPAAPATSSSGSTAGGERDKGAQSIQQGRREKEVERMQQGDGEEEEEDMESDSVEEEEEEEDDDDEGADNGEQKRAEEEDEEEEEEEEEQQQQQQDDEEEEADDDDDDDEDDEEDEEDEDDDGDADDERQPGPEDDPGDFGEGGGDDDDDDLICLD